MKPIPLIAVALTSLSALFVCTAAQAADPKKLPGNKRLMDASNQLLISKEEAVKLMDANIPKKVWMLTKGSQYVWVSQVEGGMKGTTCIVSARVMVLPLTGTLNAPLFRPRQTATAFDSAANSSTDACKVLAREKLQEATTAVVASLVKT